MHGLWASVPRLTQLTVAGNIAVAGSWRHSSPVGHNKDLWSGFVENSVCKSSDTVDLFIVATRVRLPPSADCSVIYLTCVAHLTWHSSLYYFFEVNSNSWNLYESSKCRLHFMVNVVEIAISKEFKWKKWSNGVSSWKTTRSWHLILYKVSKYVLTQMSMFIPQKKQSTSSNVVYIFFVY